VFVRSGFRLVFRPLLRPRFPPRFRLRFHQLFVDEACRHARGAVERRPQLHTALLQQRAERRHRFQSALRAQMTKPVRAAAHVRDFLVENHRQDRCRRLVADFAQAPDHARRHVEAARLQHARHQRHPRQGIVRGFFRRFPQAVVRRQVAVIAAQFLEAIAQHVEVTGLVLRHPQPVRVVRLRHAGEAAAGVECEVDCIELDVCNRVRECKPSGQRPQPAIRHLARRHQQRAGWPSGRRCDRCIARRQSRGGRVDAERGHPPALGRRIAGGQGGADAGQVNRLHNSGRFYLRLADRHPSTPESSAVTGQL
jgi:hypothetical protein